MSDYLQRYLPEYNEEEARDRLSGASKEDLLEMVIRAYKEKRVILKWLAESDSKLKRITGILQEPSTLSQMPSVPTAEDLRRMAEDDPSQV